MGVKLLDIMLSLDVIALWIPAFAGMTELRKGLLREEDLHWFASYVDHISWLDQVESDDRVYTNQSEILVLRPGFKYLCSRIFSPAYLRHISSQELAFVPKRPYAL